MANQGLCHGRNCRAWGHQPGLGSLVTGWKAGEGAAEACEGQTQLPVDEAQIAALKEKTFAKFGPKGAYERRRCHLPYPIADYPSEVQHHPLGGGP